MFPSTSIVPIVPKRNGGGKGKATKKIPDKVRFALGMLYNIVQTGDAEDLITNVKIHAKDPIDVGGHPSQVVSSFEGNIRKTYLRNDLATINLLLSLGYDPTGNSNLVVMEQECRKVINAFLGVVAAPVVPPVTPPVVDDPQDLEEEDDQPAKTGLKK